VTCDSTDGGTSRSATDTSSPITVSTLSNGHLYTCAVVATNSFGDSVPSDASSPFGAGDLPTAPTINSVVRGNKLGDDSPSPRNGDGGSAIFSYKVTCRSSNGWSDSLDDRNQLADHDQLAVERSDLHLQDSWRRNETGNSPASAASSSIVRRHRAAGTGPSRA